MSSLLLFTFVTLCCSLGLGDSENATQGCHMAKLDLVIIVDSSASVGSGNFKQIVKFILDLVKPLPVHSEGIRVALVIYSSTAHVISYLGDDMNKLQKSAVLGSMKYKPGSTRTDLGLALTRDEVLIPERGDRPDVPDQIILLTDGESTNKMGTREETRLLKKRPHLKIIVLGIGGRLDDTELLQIATSPELKHVVNKFSHLSGMLKDLESATCEERKTSVTHAPVIEVSTPPERENEVQLKNANSQTSVDNNYLLRHSSSSKVSSHHSEPSLIRQFDTTNSNVASYSIPLSGVYKSSSDDFMYPLNLLPYTTSSLHVTPSFHLYTSASSTSLSLSFYKLTDRQSSSKTMEESLFIFEISSQSEIHLQATTTRLLDNLISTPAMVPEEIQLSLEKFLPPTPLPSDESITDPDHHVFIRSVIENRFHSAHLISVFDTVKPVETVTSTAPSPPLTPLLLPLPTQSSGVLLESSASYSSFTLSPMKASSSFPITPTSTLPFSQEHSISYYLPLSPLGSSADAYISRNSMPRMMPTFTKEYKQSQRQILSSLFYKLKDLQSSSEIIEESLFIFEISRQSEIQLKATTTRLVDDQTSVLSIVPEEIQLSPSNVLPPNPLSSDVSITDTDYDVLASSVIDNRFHSAHVRPDLDAANSLDAMTSSTSPPPLTPLPLSLPTPSPDASLESSTSSSSFVLSPVNAPSSLSVTPTPAMQFSLEPSISYSLPLSSAGSSSGDSIPRNSINDIMPTFTTEYEQFQSHVFKTENSESILWTDHIVYVNISRNSSSVGSGNSTTGGDISSDFVNIYVGGGIVGLATLLATSIILARIFRNQKKDGDEAT